MTYRQFRAWHEWLGLSRPDTTDWYLMQIAQYLDNIGHMFDKEWTGKPLGDYLLGQKKPDVIPGPIKPGKVPYVEGEWRPRPMTKADIEAAHKSMKLGMAELSMRKK